jgi:hypothetical protein
LIGRLPLVTLPGIQNPSQPRLRGINTQRVFQMLAAQFRHGWVGKGNGGESEHDARWKSADGFPYHGQSRVKPVHWVKICPWARIVENARLNKTFVFFDKLCEIFLRAGNKAYDETRFWSNH